MKVPRPSLRDALQFLRDRRQGCSSDSTNHEAGVQRTVRVAPPRRLPKSATLRIMQLLRYSNSAVAAGCYSQCLRMVPQLFPRPGSGLRATIPTWELHADPKRRCFSTLPASQPPNTTSDVFQNRHPQFSTRARLTLLVLCQTSFAALKA